jgi:hypothetical protein
VDPAGFDLRLIGADSFRADWLHQHVVELDAVHGAGNDLAVERAEIQRRIHVSAALLDGVVSSAAIADNDLMSVEPDGFHPAGRDLIRADCGNKTHMSTHIDLGFEVVTMRSGEGLRH